MGMFARLISSWAIKGQKKDLQRFIDQLAAMDSGEIGFVLAIATHLRNNLEESGYRLMDPLIDYPADPTVVIRLQRLIREFQRTGAMSDAAGAMVWMHTMRVGGQHELRGLARKMWGELARGMPHVVGASVDVYRLTNKFPNTSGYDQYPQGLTPTPT
ncbi:TPA: hypothetical protein QDZ12_004212 [Pseudomonas putida]|uniref:hypothetical protein n=1 Tax=Pseudomonas sp. HD6515 TaxID=2856556 RepID=UPI00217E9ED2|nr:hypothetical protein [Pseudomonas sp. HD6515]ELS0926026.1 hypothetical protein [Pseudomonas putida]UWH23460.1 hypothetical protein KW568_03305 [Pseudomonas sp. HD6515]HDS0940914.1 hypothetical protein [Pseudomonas putida]